MKLTFRKRDPNIETMNRTARQMGLPKVMYTCEHCGSSGWRYPPHMFESCPLLIAISEAAGLKIDAERNATIAAGIQFQELGEMLRRTFGEESE